MGIRHLYRVKHNDTVNNWSVYWNVNHTFQGVPENWNQTINRLRTLEYPELNVSRYNAEVYSPLVDTKQYHACKYSTTVFPNTSMMV